MIDDIEHSDIAASWVEALRARGVTLRTRVKQLVMHPKSSFGAMSAEERATLKQHKAAIITLVRERYAGTAGPVQVAALPTSEVSAPASKPEPCAYCYQSPCVGVAHAAFYALHPIEAQKHADELATKTMMARVGKPHPWDY